MSTAGSLQARAFLPTVIISYFYPVNTCEGYDNPINLLLLPRLNSSAAAARSTPTGNCPCIGALYYGDARAERNIPVYMAQYTRGFFFF